LTFELMGLTSSVLWPMTVVGAVEHARGK